MFPEVGSMRISSRLALALVLAASLPALATVFATVHGVVHDPQHRPIANATVTLQAADSAFALSATTDSEGEFELAQAPIGTYRLQVEASGFATVAETIAIASGTNPVVHVALPVASATQTVVVEGSTAQVDSVTPATLVSREMIERTPGASRATSFAAITDFVPGAYICHDMLHMRGGHQTSWLIDGVNIPNTSIAANLGPQIAPADTDQIEVQRGSYAADIGDRTYGVFNVAPRNGFERNRDAELNIAAGNFYAGETALSAGDHSQKTAWYASVAAARSSYGLETPIAAVVRDATNSQSGFGSFLVNPNAKNQIRFNGQLRQDFFQVPYDPNQNDWLTQLYNSSGLRDGQTERDSFFIADWVHTLSPNAVFEVAPFYHWSVVNYDSKPSDAPTSTTWDRTSNYAGLQASVRGDVKRNNLAAGFYSFYQHDSSLFGVVFNDGSGTAPIHESDAVSGGIVEGSLSDSLRVSDWLTLLGGVRMSGFHGGVTENDADPRAGAALSIPRLHWVLRGFYGRYYQAPPLVSIQGPLLAYANAYNTGFAALHGERDEEHEFSVQIPYRGWMLDVDNFKTRVNNFLDHSNIGESNVFIPITVDGALVRAWEATLRSPSLWRRGQFHLAYSNQIAKQRGAITGGLICTAGCNDSFDYTPVDHDQRETLNTGFTAVLPARGWFSSNVYYGSGFSNGTAGAADANGNLISPYQGSYLPVHTTFDVSAGKTLGEHFRFALTVVNVTNHRMLTDSSLTFGGFHYNDPRQISAELRYRFHF
jgi:Carboxypeptidase regulatory-like domain/TonB dependent receptor/TonB-dependent Receptor Plug Domain